MVLELLSNMGGGGGDSMLGVDYSLACKRTREIMSADDFGMLDQSLTKEAWPVAWQSWMDELNQETGAVWKRIAELGLSGRFLFMS